jgi:nicotinamidase/pyrazinamidase
MTAGVVITKNRQNDMQLPHQTRRDLRAGDALLIVDVQKDFLPGGRLGVAGGNEIIPVLNRYIERFEAEGLSLFATRDWHPERHTSFKDQGGPWPAHCIAESDGAEFPSGLKLPKSAHLIFKGVTLEKDAYSGFEGTDLHERLQTARAERLFVGGLATDYCVLNTVRDALARGYAVCLMTDAIKAVNVQPDDGRRAIEEMTSLGAVPIEISDVAA